LADKIPRSLGSIYTPPDFARLLADWAIQEKRQKVLDVGVGEGVFAFAAYQRLIQLGARSSAAQRQVHGAEIHRPAYEKFIEQAARTKLSFPNIHCADFFSIEFPQVDAVLGNPPYVRRMYIDGIEDIRNLVLNEQDSPHLQEVSRLADLYVYFLLRAASQLKESGRLAVITADSWLNTQYGVAFKQFLRENFKVESLVSFDRQVFEAEVKPVLLFATKKTYSGRGSQSVRFIRVKNGLPAGELLQLVGNSRRATPDLVVSHIRHRDLEVARPWSWNFKAPDICEEIAAHGLMTPLSKLGKTGIGIQTLAKEFFVLTPEQARSFQIEPEYLTPLAQSPRYYNTPTIEIDSTPLFYLFYCSQSKTELTRMHALGYIERGENAVVPVRGKDKTVVGYHNKERIQEAHRPHWYDLRSALERRGRAEILIPRLIYQKFQVVRNQARFVPGELFIEFTPSNEHRIETEVYLAALTASATEVLLRASAQLYGGGTYNLSPGQLGNTPVLDVTRLSETQKETLKQAYLNYLADARHDREVIDRAVSSILGLSHATQNKLKEVLLDLISLGLSSKSPCPGR